MSKVFFNQNRIKSLMNASLLGKKLQKLINKQALLNKEFSRLTERALKSIDHSYLDEIKERTGENSVVGNAFKVKIASVSKIKPKDSKFLKSTVDVVPSNLNWNVQYPVKEY